MIQHKTQLSADNDWQMDTTASLESSILSNISINIYSTLAISQGQDSFLCHPALTSVFFVFSYVAPPLPFSPIQYSDP